jgi:hypothetical protein
MMDKNQTRTFAKDTCLLPHNVINNLSKLLIFGSAYKDEIDFNFIFLYFSSQITFTNTPLYTDYYGMIKKPD